MSAKYGKTLMLHYAELAFLLEGCGIHGVLMPPGVQTALATQLDFGQAMAGMARDGLMVEGEGGLLDYEPSLREVLLALRDSAVVLLVRSSDDAFAPLMLHVDAAGKRAVLVHEDTVRDDMACVSAMAPGEAYEDLARVLKGGVILRDEDAEALQGLGDSSDGQKAAFKLEVFPRGTTEPVLATYVLVSYQLEEPSQEQADQDGNAQAPDALFIRSLIERCVQS